MSLSFRKIKPSTQSSPERDIYPIFVQTMTSRTLVGLKKFGSTNRHTLGNLLRRHLGSNPFTFPSVILALVGVSRPLITPLQKPKAQIPCRDRRVGRGSNGFFPVGITCIGPTISPRYLNYWASLARRPVESVLAITEGSVRIGHPVS
jgi:hypothetical protein